MVDQVASVSMVVDLALVKQYCRIEHSEDDILLVQMVQAATEQANHLCARVFDASAPQSVKQWVLMRVGFMYENRTATLENGQSAVPVRHFVDGLLDPYLEHAP